MEALKSYLLTAMLSSLAASLILRIADPRFRVYIRYVAGLALLLMLTLPLFSLAGELTDSLSAPDSEHEITEPSAQEELVGEIGRAMSDQIGDLVAARYRLSRDAVSVKLTLDLADLSAITIYRLELTIRESCDGAAIERYLSASLECPVRVNVLEGDTE
ncbi:MAG: hypothetical protein IJW62_01245 [Clostridia bacterium]|nr:hypothetical protein [Clostridia bacterium]